MSDKTKIKVVIALAIKPKDQIDILQNIAVNSMDEAFFEDLLEYPNLKKVEKLITFNE
ncbi:PTS sugar transporter subunit IIA [Spiroplasma taiwanense]|uniref:PTS sugar transporter subunit IIA n=1 Tax=Spiroplasma taiwanense TaxID=2145 RepID=UPI000414C160|nr:PTS sugar transporter subunit IIA [Spiroplasma taiwanense]